MTLLDWLVMGRQPATREEASRRIVRRWLREHRGHVATLTL